ncbi:MAG: hypothetical protein KTR16_02855 [Acidiferrobacterales bacterium]|nr:hypothetical protein [Acidiferrobacterales bacterium]
MKFLAKAGVASVFALSSLAVNAQVSCNGTTQCQGPATELMASLFPSPGGGVLINSPTVVNGLPCTGNSGGSNVLLPATHPNYNQTYATLLTASVAEKDVILRIDTNEATCTLFFARMIN